MSFQLHHNMKQFRSAYCLAFAGFFAFVFCTACEKDKDECNDIQCDADCRINGHQFGECRQDTCLCGNPEVCWDSLDNDLDGNIDCYDTDCGFEGYSERTCNDGIDNDCDGDVDCYDIGDCGDTAACGACNSSACAAECRAAGHTGGTCIGDACQCSDTCTSHSQCSAGTICYHGECQDPWGKEYTLTGVNGDFPDVDWRDGTEWDFGGSCPDTYVSMRVDSTTCNTPQIEDSCHPRWNHACHFMLFASSNFSWNMYDEDTLDYDNIAGIDPMTITVEDIKAESISWYIEYAGTQYYILNITIAPR